MTTREEEERLAAACARLKTRAEQLRRAGARSFADDIELVIEAYELLNARDRARAR